MESTEVLFFTKLNTLPAEESAKILFSFNGIKLLSEIWACNQEISNYKKMADDIYFPNCLAVCLTLTLTFQFLITSKASFFKKKIFFLRTGYGKLQFD